MIEEHRSFGYRTVAHFLRFNRSTLQRIFQLMRWQVRTRPVGFRPRVRTLPSVASVPNDRWATDLCRIWSGRDGWATLALVMDCPQPGAAGLAPVARWTFQDCGVCFGAGIDRAVRHSWASPKPFLLRSDNGLVFTPGATPPWYGLRVAPGVHHATFPGTERDGGAADPNAQGAVRAPASVSYSKPTYMIT